MNNSSCDAFSRFALIIFCSGNGGSLLVCLLAAILVCILKLHKKTVDRLALYQVLSASALAAQCIGQIFLLKYSTLSETTVIQHLCQAFGFLFLYTEMVKLLFTMWVTVHLFCYAVFHKNLKRLEALYVVTSLVVPAGIASVPFTTHTYGLSQSWCWIQSRKDNCPGSTLLVRGVIEQFALWFGPAMVILSLVSLAMVVMVIILFHRAYVWRASQRNQNWKAVKQLLPLVAYPILFFTFIVPQFIIRVYDTNSEYMSRERNFVLSIATIACEVGWSLSAGVTLIAHIVVTDICSRRAIHNYSVQCPIYQRI